MYAWNDFGLCCGSVVQADFRTLAEAAAEAGFHSITLWPRHFEDALASGLSEQDLRALLADNELTITELDPLCSWLPGAVAENDLAASFSAYDESDFFRIADALGARTLNVIQASADPLPESQRVDCLASLCERAAAHGLRVSVEFMPWSAIGNLGQALALVEATGRTDCGVNIDTWHHFRSGGTLDELIALDPARVAAMQLNDVCVEPWDDLLLETAQGRELPGHGRGYAGPVLEACERAGIRVPINVEVFATKLQAMSARAAARSLADSLRAVLAAYGEHDSGGPL